MANPPFAGDIKESRILAKYEMARSVSLETIKTVSEDNKNIEDLTNRNLPTFPEFLNVSHETIYKMADGTYRKIKIKNQSNVGRDILFIERNLSFLKAGGRMAVVLPQGRFNNSSDKQVREYIAGHCRILAVVGLHGNVFKPHTGTKTSVLFVQKWHDTLCPQVDDYPIFFATMTEPSKDNSGDKIYISQADGEPLLDEHGHLIVKHDLFNHDGLTQDGIAEAFIEFAKKKKLSFFDLDLSGFKNLKGLDDASLNADLRGFKNLAGLYAEPFNEVKYLALLERLEISEVLFSTVIKSEQLRLEAEFYTAKSFQLISAFLGEEIIELSQYGTSDELNEDGKGYPILRLNEFDSCFIKSPSKYCNSLDELTYQSLKLKKGDVLICRTNGNPKLVGKSALVPKNYEFAYASYLFKIRPKKELISSATLVTYLNSKFGRMEIEKFSMASNQVNFSPAKFRELRVPKFSIELNNSIDNYTFKAFEILEESQKLYSQAENLLLNALGMADFSPSTEKVNIKSFKDSFIATGRLDAEYYQPKYEEIEQAIISFSGDFRLGNLIEYINTGEYSEEYLEKEKGLNFYIRSTNIKGGQIEEDKNHFVNPKGFTKFVQEGDIITARVGTLGVFGAVNNKISGAIYSDNVLCFRLPNTFNPNVYALWFNSRFNWELIDRLARGSVQQRLNQETLKDLIVPIIASETQNQIANLIQQSFTLKSQSEALLTTAKRAVELAIETSEQTALDFITDSINSDV
jgi:type I restriction enzyme M protein